MNAHWVDVKVHGSCSFCERGELSAAGDRIIRPYRKIWLLENSTRTTSARMCDQCKEIFLEARK